MDDLRNIIESLIFVSEGPLTLDQIKNVLPEVETRQIRAAIDGLIQEYETLPRGFHLREIAGGVQFRTRPEYKDHVAALLRSTPPKLSRAALETLAIIAYKQPIIRADIEHIRGVDSGGVLRMLMERKMVRVLGRKEIPGRPLIYATTKKFLEVFELKNLRDLPTPKEIEELSGDAGEKHGAALERVTVVQRDEPAEPTPLAEEKASGISQVTLPADEADDPSPPAPSQARQESPEPDTPPEADQ